MPNFTWLAAIPVLAALGSVWFGDRVTPFIFGIPFFMAWVIGFVLITSLVMWAIYVLDPKNK